MQHEFETDRQNVMAYQWTAYLDNSGKAVAKYVASKYIQHDPLVAECKQVFIDFFDAMARDYPDNGIEIVRAVAENDMVALHTHQTWPGNVHYVTMDFFRFDDDWKIVEYWDSIQLILRETRNGNPMY